MKKLTNKEMMQFLDLSKRLVSYWCRKDGSEWACVGEEGEIYVYITPFSYIRDKIQTKLISNL